MTQESELERLEAVVVKLLEKYDILREEKRNVEVELAAREKEIEGLESKLESSNSKRGDMSSRVQGLLGQIEDWEASLDGETDEDEEQDAAEEADEAESRMQQNLFSVDQQAEGNLG